MKKIIATVVLLATLSFSYAQTNTSPTTNNVGIGTSTQDGIQDWGKDVDIFSAPHSKLLVRSSNIKTGIFSHEKGSGSVGRVGIESNHDLRLTAGYGNDIIILTNYTSRVGIGIINPQVKLHVDFGGEPKSILFREESNAVSTVNSMIRFTWYNDTADFRMVRSGSTPIEALAVRFNGEETARFTPIRIRCSRLTIKKIINNQKKREKLC